MAHDGLKIKLGEFEVPLLSSYHRQPNSYAGLQNNWSNIHIVNKSVVIAITLHVYVLIACDERGQSLYTNQLVSIVITTV